MALPPRSVHLLPDTSTPLEKALSASDARTLDAPHDVIRQAWDAETCPEHLLPYLAAARSVDEWDHAWPIERKRQVIRDAIPVHRRKGTAGAVRRAAADVAAGARIRRWFEQVPRGRPFTFEVRAAVAGEWTAAAARRLYRAVVMAKAARSLMTALVIERQATPPPVRVGAAMQTVVRMRLVPEPATSIRVRRIAYVGAGIVSRRHVRVNPRSD